ncbi:axin interactor, dorsalization-associated protein-like isoform X2 [Littorina saxatilis]
MYLRAINVSCTWMKFCFRQRDIMAEEDDLPVLVNRWHAVFKRATDFDMWGQPVEAIDVYQRLAKQLHHYSNTQDSAFSDSQKKAVQCTGISLNDLKCLESTLQNVLGGNKNDFPLDVSMAQVQYQQLINQQVAIKKTNEDKDKHEYRGRGSLLPRPLPVKSMTLLTVRVEQIGLKDAPQFIEPFITVSVKDGSGQDMTVTQDTPRALEKQDSCLVFNSDVHIQKAIESLPPGFAVFFELKHFKPKKQMISTRCWSCLEKDEIKEGTVALELYKKPTDYRRKNISLLTVKPMYLHLRLQLHR